MAHTPWPHREGTTTKLQTAPKLKPWPRVRPPKPDANGELPLFTPKPGDPGSITKDGREVWAKGATPKTVWLRDGDGWAEFHTETGHQFRSITDQAQRNTIRRADAFVRAGCRVRLVAHGSKRGRDFRNMPTHKREGTDHRLHLADCHCADVATAFEVGEVRVAPGILARLTGHSHRYPADPYVTGWGDLADCITNPLGNAEVALRPAA